MSMTRKYPDEKKYPQSSSKRLKNRGFPSLCSQKLCFLKILDCKKSNQQIVNGIEFHLALSI
ncbi:hypothetical protein DVH24_000779 [Malus domestica]|uniref:Uncharacterized protein n=1 Tax=Malus domestica TaxID=3750 RepID=A0A498K3M2_MALDO|nr:hypothetical protein DVH24_000779 [Malus domestica]